MEKKKGLVYTTIAKKNVTILVIVLLFVAGIFSYISLPKQEYPVIQYPMAIITTVYPGASAEDMEELVSSKIEDECMKATGFEKVKSDSYNSTSVVKVTFSRDLSADDLKTSMNDLRNSLMDLKETDLPSGVTKLVYNDNAFETCGLIIAFTSDKENNQELVQRAESLKDELSTMEGVSKVEVEGEIEQRVKITVDSSKLNHLDVSLAELSSIIDYQNSMVPVGTMEFDDDEIYINSSGKLADLDEISDIIITVDRTTGAVVKLKDVATVEMSPNEDSKRYSYNGKSAVILSLYFNDDVNVLDIGKNVMTVVDKYKETVPDTVEMNNVIYLPNDVNSSINDFIVNLIESVVIVLAVVMIGMSIKNGIITSVAIPLTIFVSFVFMKLFSVDIQFVSLASLIIALGMLVDNAIVVSDAIQVRVDNDEDKFWACVNGAKDVAVPVFTSTLTTVAIFMVFYVLPGTMRKFVFSLPTIVIIALLTSYVISMLVTPLMCYLLIKKSTPKKERKNIIRDFFSNLLNICLKAKLLTITVAIVAICLSAWLLSTLNLELVPNSDKKLLDITVTTDNFYDIRKTDKAIKQIEEILNNYSEVEFYLSSTGGRIPKYEFTSMPGTDSTSTGNIVLRINLKDSEISTDKATFCQYLSDDINSKVSGCKIIVKEMGIIPKSSEPVQINVCGTDFETLNNASIRIEQILKDMDGTKDIYSDRKIKTYDYNIDMDNNSLNSAGLTKAEVQNELNIALMGREVTTYRKQNKEYPVILQTETHTISGLEQLKIKSSITGSKFNVSQVAKVGLKNEYTAISRYNGKRSVTISCSTKEGTSPVEVQIKLAKALESEDLGNVTFEYEGDNDMFVELMSSLLKGAIAGVLGIFLILYMQFYSIKRAIIVFISIPFSIIGASIGLWITGQNLSFFAILGIISLIGVVVNNAIVLIDYMDTQLKTGVSPMEACKTAVSMRFRPIMLSSTTTILGLIPLAFGNNVLFKGLAIAFMSGLSTSLFFTLVIIPVVYSMVIKKPSRLEEH